MASVNTPVSRFRLAVSLCEENPNAFFRLIWTGAGYRLVLDSGEGRQWFSLSTARDESRSREFKTADAAIGLLVAEGFLDQVKEIRVMR
jgi:hypothetical protein